MRRRSALCALIFAMSASAAVPSSEREALVALYQSTNGNVWTNKANWLGASGTECTWFGVTCDETQGHVVDLELYQNNLDGTLPADLRKLTALRSVQFWDNNLRGSLPSELSELPQLETFYAQRNHFTGRVPAAWGALKKLAYLGLDGNELVGPIPSQIGDMTALVELGLSYNAINGGLPKELGKLQNLTYIWLSVNRVSGSIPKELGSLPKLEVISMADNDLTGPIPAELGNLPAIQGIDLAYNDLTGGVPAALGKPQTLEILSLLSNPLGGTIPKELGDLPKIRILNLAETQLKGTIPQELFDLDTLEELQLGGNDLTGTIPAGVAKLTKLQVLGLYSNDLHGAIPAALADVATLRSLELQDNALTGTIPADLARLTSLTWVDLALNDLEGTIPPQLGSLASLETLSLYENQLSGAIPGELGQLTKLRILYLGGNRLTGAFPDALRNLTEMEQFSANGNRLTGSIPPWIGEWKNLRDFIIGTNLLRGTVPASLETLEKLEYLDLGDNELTGRFPELSRMRELRYLTGNNNFFTGPLPAGLGTLTKLVDLRLDSNAMTGPLPRELGGLTAVEYVNLSNNSFEGAIPPELGNLDSLLSISLWGNRLSGTIPKEIGNLPKLQSLDLSFNALRGPIPKEITKLTTLEDQRSDFAYNALFTTDPTVRAFMNAKHHSGDFEELQTVTPVNAKVALTTDRSATLTWTPIRYFYDGGGYQVVVSKSANGAPVAVATTNSKEFDTITVRSLEPSTQYFFTVSTVTHPHDYQENLLVSDPTPPLSARTGQRVVAPADVVIVEQPAGMVRIDGVEVVPDRFTVTNFGDVATSLTVERGGDFFTVTPEAFDLGPGASQVVTLHSLPSDAGTYYGHVVIRGDGTNDDSVAYLVMLATTRPAGTVVAQPLASTIEVAGAPGADSVGTVQFRNAGTAPLTGIVLSDQAWIEPSRDPITIEPGQVVTINFRIVRSRRPPSEGALVANLRLVYVSGGAFARGIRLDDTTPPPGVSVSIVTVVDTTRPDVTTGPIPALGAGEIPLFIPGMRTSVNTHSDLALYNALGSRSIGDLKLYFTQGGQTSIAALQPLGASSALNLVNLADSIFDDDDAAGTLQVRTTDAESLGAHAKVTQISPEGARGGTIPVFRGDRAIVQGESLVLAGLTAPGDVLLQETTGAAASVHVEFLNAAGGAVDTRDALLGPWELVDWSDAIPSVATSAIVTSVSGGLTAHARLRDAGGDVWSVVDWSRFYQYAPTSAVRVPFADGRGGAAKRRVVRNDAAARFSTSLTLFNPGDEEARARIDTIEPGGRTFSRDVALAPHATQTLTDAAASASTATAQLVITPTRGEVLVTARSRGTSGGTAIPVLDASAGLRLGQRHTFTALDDSLAQRTSFGFAETSGASITIRARIFIEGGNSLVTTVTERDYDIAANAQIFVPELVRAFAGDARDSLGDLHNLVLELEVVAGSGSVVPFVIATDEGTGDTSLRL